jgi:hypothetical protein
MNPKNFSKALERKIQNLSFPASFRVLASLYSGTEYKGGKESFESDADCSGTVCGPLLMLGYNIRTTADGLYRHIFTKSVKMIPDVLEDPERVFALFFLTNQSRIHFDREVPAGYAIHVAPIVGRYTALHAHGAGIPNQIVTTQYLYNMYTIWNNLMVWREIDMDALVKHSTLGDMSWGLDAEMETIIKE